MLPRVWMALPVGVPGVVIGLSARAVHVRVPTVQYAQTSGCAVLYTICAVLCRPSCGRLGGRVRL